MHPTTAATATADALITEQATKHQRLVALLEERGADSLLLTSAGALSWYLGGARVHVSLAGGPIAAVLVHRGGAELGLFTNEAARLRAEELGGSEGVTVHEVPWHGNLHDVAAWYPEASAWSILGEEEVAAGLRAARASLLPAELQRYRTLCRDAAAALTDVLTAATGEMTERQVAAELARAVVTFGADPVVVLVSGDSRAQHRHPLPTDAPLGRRAMAVVCARKYGLIANVTRWVTFGELLDGEEELDRRILEVEAEILGQLRPGAAMDELLPVIQEAYPRHGFAEDEWTKHHQGGAAGYNGRDPRLAPGVADTLVTGQAFAWNPTAADPLTGLVAKVEDTILLTEREGAPVLEVLSVDERWPSVEVAGRQRPAVLRR
ncbi:M24 family metallopeptidase [Zhihengliuella flava]|uniref:Xaa-Pro aminopeptidase n=1 Tax=Zhihengliuella flava TaxID=1285193 RepID=A0A931D5X8_9MICC|nr:M24 family metallopeptidase [Zhihengliuella flava]MBG6084310.1 Xaa-Pro aminopeptidase [Zhihengliuella flava]